jgi:hypothetical protein
MYSTEMLAAALALAFTSSALAGWLLYRVKRLQELVEALQTRLVRIERQPARADSGARVRELLGARSWAAPQAERGSLEAAAGFAGADKDNPTDPALRAMATR